MRATGFVVAAADRRCRSPVEPRSEHLARRELPAGDAVGARQTPELREFAEVRHDVARHETSKVDSFLIRFSLIRQFFI